ncbi:NADPH-dependent F420 reductase [Archangium gephyra]|uniref:NADPH-dependent F420 reductase n=1 Tax=Archangium gephyra TaxID=48 RepID=UPI003B764AF8
MTTLKIAIIGNGNVGSALEKGAQRAGYEVRTTGADPTDVRAAGAWGDIIVLAIPASARQDAIKNLGDIKGKTLVDPTNLLNQDWSYAGDLKKSGAEQVQEWAAGARVVKAFNTVFAQNMATGKVKGESLGLLVAGDDAGAKTQVLDLGKAIGFAAVDVGPLINARYLEALGFLNIQLGYGPTQYGTDLGFKVVGLGK